MRRWGAPAARGGQHASLPYLLLQICALHNADTFFCVVDLHAITVPHSPAELKASTRAMAATYIAAGIDPQRSTVFVQSHVPAHAELQWLLNCVTPLGWLNRMIQFKEQSRKQVCVHQRSSVRAGSEDGEPGILGGQRLVLSTFPPALLAGHGWCAGRGRQRWAAHLPRPHGRRHFALPGPWLLRHTTFEPAARAHCSGRRADLPSVPCVPLIIPSPPQADLVPVGEDQKQHLELTRDIAERVNNTFGGKGWKKRGGRGGRVFRIPEPFIPPAGARVMSLQVGAPPRGSLWRREREREQERPLALSERPRMRSVCTRVAAAEPKGGGTGGRTAGHGDAGSGGRAATTTLTCC